MVDRAGKPTQGYLLHIYNRDPEEYYKLMAKKIARQPTTKIRIAGELAVKMSTSWATPWEIASATIVPAVCAYEQWMKICREMFGTWGPQDFPEEIWRNMSDKNWEYYEKLAEEDEIRVAEEMKKHWEKYDAFILSRLR